MARSSLTLAASGAAVTLLFAGCAAVLPISPPSRTTPAPYTVSGVSSAPVITAGSAATATLKGFTAYERAALRIRNITCEGVEVGSGFAVAPRVIVTNRHVVDGAAVLQLQTYDGHDRQVATAGVATFADLAIVRISDDLAATLPLASANPKPGDPITVVGYPGGGELTTSHGHVLRYGADIVGESDEPMIINDAPIAHGSSGSPLVDAAGEVVGVAYAGKPEGPFWAVPVELLRQLIDSPTELGPVPPCG
ncbi:MAG: serine protease [Intrasporangium sp.]|uniref:S1C family serine protease n=1 Tax=Intrasporangium sp. TaxID=1925024 RepID=UPI002649B695|nr:serine protease [Intrasporangium sp.]MDN5798087.1 serine protease [Intrasporangium sp.]